MQIADLEHNNIISLLKSSFSVVGNKGELCAYFTIIPWSLIPWQRGKPVCWDVTDCCQYSGWLLLTYVSSDRRRCCGSCCLQEGSQVLRSSQQLHLPTTGIWDFGSTECFHHCIRYRSWSPFITIYWRLTWDSFSVSAPISRYSKVQLSSDTRNLWFLPWPAGPLAFPAFVRVFKLYF